MLKYLKIYDVVLCVILLGFSLTFWIFSGEKKPDKVIIKTSSSEYQYSLLKNRIIKLKANEGVFVISISNKKVRVVETHCFYKLCKKNGKISKPGQAIICLPQKIEILIEGRSEKLESVDAVCH